MVKILLIEDYEPDKILFERLMQKNESIDAKIDSVGTLAAALSSLEKQSYDLIVSDLSLPDCHGLDSLTQLGDFLYQIPTIIITGNDDDTLLAEASKIGVFDYLIKNDLTAGMLRRSIRYAMSRFEAEQNKEKLEFQLRRSQRLDSLGKLTGGIAHDFNNKLAIISANLEILKTLWGRNQNPTKSIQSIQRTVTKSAALTRQLLAFGQKQELDRHEMNINEVVCDCIRLFQRVLPSNIEVETLLSTEDLFSKVDPSQMDQVLMNLLINAQQAIGEDAGKITLTVHMTQTTPTGENLSHDPGPYICISVKDTGVGMSPEVKNRVFEPFYTTKSEGTGLGLSVVDGIIRQMGGFLDVASTPHEGTMMTMYLKPSAEKKSKKDRQSPRTTSHDSAPCSVLYVEDESELREITANLLVDLGFQVTEATNGKEALDIFTKRDTNIDVILTDMMMPEMDGKELMIKVRAFDPSMGFVFVSGYSQSELTKEGALPEKAHFHPKPPDIQKISRSLRQLAKKNTSKAA